MKLKDMNSHQIRAYEELCTIYSEVIGGYENTMLDYPEGTDEYAEAYEFLNQPTNNIIEALVTETFKSLKFDEKAMTFAGKDFLKERAIRKLTKDGYVK